MKNSIIILSVLWGFALGDDIFDAAITSYNASPDLPNFAAPFGDAVPETQDAYNQTQTVADVVASVADSSNSSVVLTSVAVRNVIVERVPAPVVVCTTRSYNGPQVTTPTDSPNAFISYPPFTAAASSAAQDANIPPGYALVPEFVDLTATAQTSNYLTYTTMGLSSYNPSICATKCNAIAGCNAFNIYYERTPLIVSDQTEVPDPVLCPGLTTSPSATLLKCAFYGMPFTALAATNVGQFEGQFRVVFTGSNAYIKTTAPTLSEFEGPVPFYGNALNAPAPVIDNGYLRVQTFGQNGPYDPSLCAASCAAQTIFNAANPIGLGPCVFFNVYVLQENGANGILTCTYFSVPYGLSYATMPGQYDLAGNYYGVTNSYGYYIDGYFVE